jgi:PD-(D/E)XK nuclease superfamily
MTEIIYKKESYAIIGACFEVYNEKGCGFLEPSIKSALPSNLNTSGFRRLLNHRSFSVIVVE